jgi:hypothetical protein
MIGSSEDIARRIEEQLERPKAMFADEGRVSSFSLYAQIRRKLVEVRAGSSLSW